MVIDLIILCLALAALLKASDVFVDSSVHISRFFGVSEFFIGTTLIALGTSLPELATSAAAAVSNHPGIIMGNIIGSNITNFTLVLGIASVSVAITAKRELFVARARILLGISVLLFILSLDGVINWVEGVLFLAIFIAYLQYNQRKEKRTHDDETEELVQELYGDSKRLETLTEKEKEILHKINYSTYQKLLRQGVDIKQVVKINHAKEGLKLFSFALLSIGAIIISSRFLVSAATGIAQSLEIRPEIIAMSLIAFGTSVPELAVAITAAKKKLADVLLGELVGSNIINILLVGGLSALIIPLPVTSLDKWVMIPFMILITLLFRRYLQTKWLGKVFQGLTLVFFYGIFLFILVISTGIS